MPIFLEADDLRKLYWEQGFSIAQMAKMRHSSVATIHRHMVKFRVPRRSLSESIRESKLGELNPRWGGDSIKPSNGRCRARRMYPLQPCHICGRVAERHHKDGNTLNNESGNIDFLCRRHHMIIDGRMTRRNNGQFRGKQNGVLSRN